MDGMLWEIGGISHRCDITITHSGELILVHTWTLIGKFPHVIKLMKNSFFTCVCNLEAMALDYNPEVAHRHTWWSTETSLKLPFHTCQMPIQLKATPLVTLTGALPHINKSNSQRQWIQDAFKTGSHISSLWNENWLQIINEKTQICLSFCAPFPQ